MTKKVLFVSAILLAVALVAIAADSITGKWVYDMPAFGRGGGGGGGAAPAGPPRQVTMDLKADGATLTGSVTTPGFARGGGDPPPPTTTPISNGKVNGDSFSFEVTRDMGGNSFTTKYEGSVSGAEMKLKTTTPGFNGGDPRVSDVVAKKQ
jgi:opacity protein-like surface antigen